MSLKNEVSDKVTNSIVTGVLRDVRLCTVTGTDVQFLFGYVTMHVSPRYAEGDWFASSYVVDINDCEDGMLVNTANSTYMVSGYKPIEIPSAAITNIRMGTQPEKALALLEGAYGKVDKSCGD